MPTINGGLATLTRDEMLEFIPCDQHYFICIAMNKLKERGAPVVGCFYPVFSSGFTIIESKDIATGDIVFSWSKNADN